MSYVGAAVTVLAIALAVAGSIPAYTDISIGDIDGCPVLDIFVHLCCVCFRTHDAKENPTARPAVLLLMQVCLCIRTYSY